MINKSKAFINANDSIRRTTGLDIRKTLGGKSAAEIAEQRLKDDLANKHKSSYNGIGGYQSVVIPIDAEEKIQSNSTPYEVKQPQISHMGNKMWRPDEVKKEES